MTVIEWFQEQMKITTHTASLYSLGSVRWPVLQVHDKKATKSPGVLQRRLFKLHKQIKKEAAIASYYPMSLMLGNGYIAFFFNNDEERAAALKFLQNDPDFSTL